jgi:two-component system, OmpR family, sensor histidine kinase TctE
MSPAVRTAPALRTRLLLAILLPVVALVALNALGLYRQALRWADTAYDRTLLASAKSIGELLQVTGSGANLRLQSTVLYSALEPFEADNRSRIYFRVSGFKGEMVSGFADLPVWRGRLPAQGLYAALVDFYDDRFRGEPVRVAVLLQPVAGEGGQGMATIQVAETLELRRALARRILLDTLWRQALLLAVIVAVVMVGVQWATRPVRRLSEDLRARADDDLQPLHAAEAPRELQPLLEATNQLMQRLSHLLEHQKRFVRDTSHQLRTPLAVLKVQVQSALRGDAPAAQALQEIGVTVERATILVNQMLALAKVEQLRQQGDAPLTDWAPVVREVALELAPLLAQQALDFELDAQPCTVQAHAWALRELTRNLLHNAIRHSPLHGRLQVRLQMRSEAPQPMAELVIADDGPGLSEAMRLRLFQPFSQDDDAPPPARSHGATPASGSGLGLAIVHEIVSTLHGRVELFNRPAAQGQASGLDARVRLPCTAAPRAPALQAAGRQATDLQPGANPDPTPPRPSP